MRIGCGGRFGGDMPAFTHGAEAHSSISAAREREIGSLVMALVKASRYFTDVVAEGVSGEL